MRYLSKLSVVLYLLLATSCGQQFLDVKPNQKQRVPQSVEDFMGLMDHSSMNQFSSHILGMIGSDEMYLTEEQYNSFPVGTANNYQKNAYTWNDVIYEGGEPQTIDWTRAYWHILWTNLALEGVASLPAGVQDDRADVTRGMALFHRAFNYYSLAQLYCKPYNEATAATDLGLPLRLSADVAMQVERTPLARTYDQILSDLKAAELLLPDFATTTFRPSKWAVYAMLARVYLQMENYQEALNYATLCLSLKNELIDFNQLDLTADYPFPVYGDGNPEVIYTCIAEDNATMTRLLYNADTNLLAGYGEGDLRLQAYFQTNVLGLTKFNGSYYGTRNYFTGLAIDEVYLISTESKARTNDAAGALADLNALRANRIDESVYVDLELSDPQAILDLVILERRKELVMRGTRWEDIRRLNKSPRYATILTRQLGDMRYQLRPEDENRWVWPLPVEAVQVGKYPQNER